MSFEGTLDRVGLRDVATHLADDRATGILTLQNEHEILAVTFQHGEIVGADSLNQGEEGLGELLAAEGLVAPYEFAAVVAAHRTGGGRVTDLLLERGAVRREDLLAALRRHTQQLLQQAMGWHRGSYKFYMGDEVAFEDGFVPIAVEELLGGSSVPLPPSPVSGGLADRFDPSAGLGDAAPTQPLRIPEGAGARATERGAAPRAAAGAVGAPPASTLGESWRALVPPEPGFATVTAGSAGLDRAWSAEAAPAREGFLDAMRPSWPAVAGLLLVSAWFLLRPGDLLGALPWTSGGPESFDTSRRIAAFQKVDAAARVFHLVEGRYPRSLDELVTSGGLDHASASDPSGARLELASNGASYSIAVPGGLEPGELTRAVESIAGDLFLDDDLFRGASDSDDKPLILLD